MLAGFLALPSAFDDDSSKFKLPQQVLQALAFTLLVLGYLGTGVICWRQKNQLFQHDTIFMYASIYISLSLTHVFMG